MPNGVRHEPYWIATTPETSYPAQTADLQVDVAIIGGGIVGITAAHLLKAAGARVAVLEAHRIVTGVTGHTTAKVTSAHGIKYHDLIRRHGRERARMYGEANQAALEMIVRTAESRGIDCDLRRMPACTYADTERTADRVEREVEAAQSLGLPATYLPEVSSLPYRTHGAVCFANQALFHPRKYLLALAETVPGDGSEILENTRAYDVELGRPHAITTDRGVIRATHVIVATHYPFMDRGFYYARLLPRRSYVLATRLEGAPPEGLFISAESDFRSIRPHPTADGGWLVLVGGEVHITGHDGDTERHYQDLERWARANLRVGSVAYRWSTQDAFSPDGIPFVGAYTPGSDRLYVATGFGGWGMTNGTAAAMMLSDTIQGRRNPWAEAYQPARVELPSTLARAVRIGSSATKHLVGARLGGPDAWSFDDVGVGEGKIVSIKGVRMATYRDDDGTLYTVSPACSHQGCYVRWNSAERTWDCPCHGSRFRPDGTFIQSPTARDLKRIEPPE